MTPDDRPDNALDDIDRANEDAASRFDVEYDEQSNSDRDYDGPEWPF